MKAFLFGLALMSMLPLGFGQTSEIYINSGSVNGAPQIDARNFLNNGAFRVTSFFPYYTYNTLNYTNTGQMEANDSFVFQTNPTQSGGPRSAVNFVNQNGGVVSATRNIDVHATNVVNRGSLSVGNNGRITIRGKTLDLFGSVLTNSNPLQLKNEKWGIGDPAKNGSYSTTDALSPAHETVSLTASGYSTVATDRLSVSEPVIFLRETLDQSGNTSHVQVVFLTPPDDTSIGAEVFFQGGALAPFVRVSVQWSNAIEHAETTRVSTNRLVFTDFLAVMDRDDLELEEYASLSPAFAFPTFKPNNYTLGLGSAFGTAAEPVADIPKITEVDSMLYTRWDASLAASKFDLMDPAPEVSLTNQPGRIELIAEERLDLSRTRIAAVNYLEIQATNHFVGSSRSHLNAPYFSLNLASTNQVLELNGLVPDEVGRYNGQIRAWSGLWTYTKTEGDTTYETNYHIVILDSSELQSAGPSIVTDFKARAPQIILGDLFNVQQAMNLQCEALTISDEGELNFASGEIVWNESIPNLRNLTNSGAINSSNTVKFMDGSQPTAPAGAPYEWFVNTGDIFVGSLSVFANNLIHGGVMDTEFGDANLRFGNAVVTNSSIDSGLSIGLTGSNLSVSNTSLVAKGQISVAVSDNLSDTGVDGSNFWRSENGFDLSVKPSTGDLLGTTILTTAAEFSEVQIRWAGEERGRSSAGYQNNAAVGNLWLNGGFASVFTFLPNGSQNALYVKNLALSEEIEADFEAGFTDALNVNPNVTIYFQNLQTLIVEGEGEDENIVAVPSTFDPSAFESKTGGRVRWMGAGRTVVNLRDRQGNVIGTINVDAALRNSDSIDSDGDGIANKNDTFPFDGPMLQTQITEAGAVHLQWDAAANTTYSLWSTQNFTSWQKVTDIASGATNGPLAIQIPASTNACTFKVSYSP